MRAGQSIEWGVASSGTQPSKRRGQVPQKAVYTVLYDVTLGWILRKLWLSLQKLIVALKYQCYKSTAGLLGGKRLSWFKLGLAALVIFIVLKKDIQFSINMKAPAGAQHPAQQTAQPMQTKVEELGMGNLSIKGNAGSATVAPEKLDEQKVRIYVRRFSKVAQAEMQKYSVPASVKMAQGILESTAGQLPATLSSNNHFGTPLAGRNYESAWESWRMHSEVLKERYATLFNHGNDYKKWTKGLKEAGYSNDRQYDKKLNDIIEKYQLYLLDEQ